MRRGGEDVDRMLFCAYCANTSGSRSLPTSASSIAREETPVRLLRLSPINARSSTTSRSTSPSKSVTPSWTLPSMSFSAPEWSTDRIDWRASNR
jgi:hypothetical protein